jgi:probable phosphoglycerate mutase
VTELLLIRHGLPVSRVLDPGLSDEGLRQARRLGDWLAVEGVDVLVSSPMRRAQETASAIAERMGRKLDATIEDLREWDTDLPASAYVSVEEMGPMDPRALAVAEGRYEDFVPALDVAAFRRRAMSCLESVFEQWPTGRVAAVCHGGILNAMLGGVLEIPQVFWFNPGYTSVSRLERLDSGRTVVRSVNETAHLVAVQG